MQCVLQQYYDGTVAKFGNKTKTCTCKVKRAEETLLIEYNTIDFFSGIELRGTEQCLCSYSQQQLMLLAAGCSVNYRRLTAIRQ